MLSMAQDGGEIALSLIEHIQSDLKPDTSIITEADRRVSALVQERLAPLLKTGKHVLIDEEDPRKSDYLDQSFLVRTPFVWSVDPIDATRAYANRLPFGKRVPLRTPSDWRAAVSSEPFIDSPGGWRWAAGGRRLRALAELPVRPSFCPASCRRPR